MESRKRKSTRARARKPRRKPAPSLASIIDRVNDACSAASVTCDALTEDREDASAVLLEYVVVPLREVSHSLERLARGGAK